MTHLDYRDFAQVGPGTSAGQWLRSFWQPVCIAEQLLPGQAMPIRILGEDFTLYRGEGGAPHLVGFRCAHRGTQLSVGWVEGDCIRCLYHGWRYDGAGQCLGQPTEPEPFAGKVRIAGYPTQEYIGLIFAYLGEGAPPPLTRYTYAEDPGCVLRVTQFVRNTNYFQSVENVTDPSHFLWTHRRWMRYETMECPQVGVEETTWGIKYWLTLSNGEKHVHQFGMPNAAYLPRADFSPSVQGSLHWIVPIDDERLVHFTTQYDRSAGKLTTRTVQPLQPFNLAQARELADRDAELAGEILAGRMTLDDLDRETVALGNLEDYVAQLGQGVLWDRTNERLGRSDVGVILMRKIYERELKALAEGRPRKQWALTPDVVAAVEGSGYGFNYVPKQA